jgi:hypothetical protein
LILRSEKEAVELAVGAALGVVVGVGFGYALVSTLSAWACSFNTLCTVALFLVVSACCLKICMSWLMVSIVMFGGGMTPAMADVKLPAAQMSAFAGVSVGMVR